MSPLESPLQDDLGVIALPLFLPGFGPAMILTMAGLSLFCQFWMHPQLVGHLPGWLEAVLNTPSHHRVHHAANVRYLDRNLTGG